MIDTIIETQEQLDNSAWSEFLKHKRGNVLKSYSEHRRCVICRTPIVNDNPNEYCRECGNNKLVEVIKNTYPESEHNKAESKAHRELKEVAREYLEKIGCINITYEKKLGKIPKSVIIDVYGELNGKRISVECGGNNIPKLKRSQQYSDIIYILPFNESTPYEWNDTIKFCHICGHKISEVKKHYSRY